MVKIAEKKQNDGSKESLENVLSYKNSNLDTLLHICAKYNLNNLMGEICQTQVRKTNQHGLMVINWDGYSVLNLIKNQDTMIDILSQMTLREMNFTHLDIKGRNILHNVLYKKDFVKVIKTLENSIPGDTFLNMILQPGGVAQNNVLMRAALNRSSKSLLFLLFFYFIQRVDP